MTMQEEFLDRALEAAHAAGHIFPEYAACEAALESSWGQSRLALQANNLFGQKQSHPPVGESVCLPTKEFLYGSWVTVSATWARFADWNACFSARMALLRKLACAYPTYAAALAAKDGSAFITLVSRKWSTDPSRAAKVLAVWQAHHAVIASALLQL